MRGIQGKAEKVRVAEDIMETLNVRKLPSNGLFVIDCLSLIPFFSICCVQRERKTKGERTSME